MIFRPSSSSSSSVRTLLGILLFWGSCGSFSEAQQPRECFLGSQCEAGERCERRRCVPQLMAGAPCRADSDCWSRSCGRASRTCDECSEDSQCPTGVCTPQRSCEFSVQSTPELLAQTDRFTRFLVGVLPQFIIFFQNNLAPTDSDVVTDNREVAWRKTGAGFDDWTRELAVQMVSIDFPNSGYELVAEDDTYGRYSFPEEVALAFTRSDALFDFEDVLSFPSLSELDAVLEETNLAASLPVTYTSNFDMLSDESFSRIFFYGLGVTILAQQAEVSDSEFGPIVADMPLDALPVRPGFRPLGCRVHFGEDQLVTAILDYHTNELLQPGDAGWEDAKFLARSSCFTTVTVREHLIWTHMIMSNSLAKASILEVPPSHPIARLLKIFTFRTNEINTLARDTLLKEDAALHRTVGFTYEGMELAFDDAYRTSNIFEPFPRQAFNSKLVELSEQNRFPFLAEGVAFYNIVEGFVTEWMEEAGPEGEDEYALAFYNSIRDDSTGQRYEIPEYSPGGMIDLLSQMIFVSTAYHEVVGSTVEYAIDAGRSATRISEQNPSVADLQTFVLLNSLTSSTALPMPPLIGRFENWFGAGGAPAWERTVWDRFYDRLVAQSETVREADRERIARSVQNEFPYLDPANFESSVAV